MLILNIGLPCAGMAYLQKRIFPRVPELRYVHRSQGPQEDRLCAALRKYVAAPGLTAGIMRQAITSRAFSRLEAMDEGELPPNVLICDETLSLQSRRFWRGEGPDPVRVAERLHALVASVPGHIGPVRILIGLERQDIWLAERYAMSARRESGFSQADFDARLMRIAESQRLPGSQGWLEYDHVFKAFAERFGADAVVVFWQEHLAERPARMLRQMGHELGGLMLVKPFRNQRRRGSPPPDFAQAAWPMPNDAPPLELREDLAAAVLSRFATSNSHFAAMTGVAKGRVAGAGDPAMAV